MLRIQGSETEGTIINFTSYHEAQTFFDTFKTMGVILSESKKFLPKHLEEKASEVLALVEGFPEVTAEE